MRLSAQTNVRAPGSQRQTAVLRPRRSTPIGRRRSAVTTYATLNLGSRSKKAEPQEGGTGLGGLFGTISRSLSRQGSRGPAPKGDDKTVFVAGATGRLGARVLRELLAAGFKVRAAARDVDQAKANTDIAVQFGLIAPDQLGRLTWVEMDLEDPDSIRPAIGNASKVISCVGAPESATFDTTAPRRIDGDGSVALVEAAAAAGVKQFVMVTSLGTGKFGLPAGVLNLFWGVLNEKRKAEQALERSGMSYCIVRPGGMERPRDDYKQSHNLVIKPRDSIFGGQVSRLQVAELAVAAVLNPELAENKCLEVVAETTAPAMALEALLERAATEITKEEQEQLAAVESEARAEIKAAQQALAQAQEALAVTSDKVAQLTDALKEAKAAEKEVRGEAGGVLREGRAAQQALAAAEAAAEKAARQESAARAVLEAAKKAGAAGELLSQRDLQAIFNNALNPPKEPQPQKAASPVPFGLFGAARPQQAQVEEEEEEVVEVAAPALPFAGLFGAKRAQPVQVEEEVEEEVVEVARPASPFAALFGGQKAQVEEEEEVVEEEEEEEEAAPARPASPLAGLFGGAAKPAAAPPAAKEPTPAPAAKKAEAPAAPAKPASPFAGLFGGSQTIQVGDVSKIAVPDKETAAEPAPAARKAAPAPAPAAAAAAAAAAGAAASAAAAAAEQKRKAAVEEAKKALQQEQAASAAAEAQAKQQAAAAAKKQEDADRAARIKAEEEAKAAEESRARAANAAAELAAAEAAALARIKAEKQEEARKAAEAKAKAEEAERAKALAAQKAAAEKAAQAAAAAAPKPAPAAAAPAAAPKPAAAAAPKPAEAAAAPPAAKKADGEVPANVLEARQWIANWRAKQGKGGAPPPAAASSSSAAAAKPAAAAPAAAPAAAVAKPPSSSSNGAPVPENVREARQWIANWRAKQGIATGSSTAAAGGQDGPSSAPPSAQQQGGGDVEVVEQEDIMASVTKFFQGFGGKK